MGNRESIAGSDDGRGSADQGSRGNPGHRRRHTDIPADVANGEDVNPSTWQLIKMGYQELVNAIIRPPRARYTVLDLGPPQFAFCGKDFRRVDFELNNPRGMVLQCSLWEPVPSADEPPVVRPCVVYMHGNSSCRAEAIPQLALVLSMGAALLAFDFAGSGLSEGDYVSLGFFEKDDLAAVIEYLRNSNRFSTIALWGRSMGAATALLHGERDPSIAAMVLDSAFSNLQQLAEEMVDKGREQGYTVPNWIVRLAIRFIRSSVSRAAGFDIRELSPISKASKCFIPALFVAAQNDDFVPPHHSEAILEQYGGDKNLILVEGDHNSNRPRFMYDSVAIFLMTTLQIPQDQVLEGASDSYGQPPWITSFGFDILEDELPLELLQALGMTEQRQQEVQAALMTMFGDRRAADVLQGNVASTMEQMTLNGNDTTRQTEWACRACTLINLPKATRCRECLTLREEEEDLPEPRARDAPHAAEEETRPASAHAGTGDDEQR